MGVYLPDRIMDILHIALDGGVFKPTDLKVLDHTWIQLTLEFDHDFGEHLNEKMLMYAKGIVTGLLIQAGVEVI